DRGRVSRGGHRPHRVGSDGAQAQALGVLATQRAVVLVAILDREGVGLVESQLAFLDLSGRGGGGLVELPLLEPHGLAELALAVDGRRAALALALAGSPRRDRRPRERWLG